MRKLLPIAILFLLNSCVKDRYTTFNAYLINQSSVDIQILPYKSGIVRAEDTIHLEPGDTVKIDNGEWRLGDIQAPLFFTDILAIGENDSIKVVYNDENYVLHVYHVPPEDAHLKYITYTMDRFIMNGENYEFEMIRSKKSWINNHHYIFTEADYEFAKE